MYLAKLNRSEFLSAHLEQGSKLDIIKGWCSVIPYLQSTSESDLFWFFSSFKASQKTLFEGGEHALKRRGSLLFLWLLLEEIPGNANKTIAGQGEL